MCALYKVDDACYELFCSNSPVERQLPPNQAYLLQHIKRGTYQTKIWKLATTAMMNCLSPADHGWTVSRELLSVNWMEGGAVLNSVLQTSFCSCTSGKCSCSAKQLKCTDMCRCLPGCENIDGTSEDKDDCFSDSDDD